jgi:hypothetical protein
MRYVAHRVMAVTGGCHALPVISGLCERGPGEATPAVRKYKELCAVGGRERGGVRTAQVRCQEGEGLNIFSRDFEIPSDLGIKAGQPRQVQHGRHCVTAMWEDLRCLYRRAHVFERGLQIAFKSVL